MSLRIMPDVEAVTIVYLNGQADVLTVLGGERVYSAVPNTPTYPLVVVRRLGGEPVVREHLDEARLQVDAWADTKADARSVAATVLAALYQMPGNTPDAVVTSVDELRGLTWLPDDLVPTPRPRYSFDVAVTVHPNPS